MYICKSQLSYQWIRHDFQTKSHYAIFGSIVLQNQEYFHILTLHSNLSFILFSEILAWSWSYLTKLIHHKNIISSSIKNAVRDNFWGLFS